MLPATRRKVASFNPLHCGAVVASLTTLSPVLLAILFQSPSLRGSGRFKTTLGSLVVLTLPVSIPFIAGQWSLLGFTGRIAGFALFVSIPFIAGQWSLQAGGSSSAIRCGSSFNPLHCGAVVASRCAKLGADLSEAFQSPSLRGSGRFSLLVEAEPWLFYVFQSPSLRGSGRFSPQHFGERPGTPRFNPLHCGTVVASHPAARRGGKERKFQSPSLRGSGRFQPRLPKAGGVSESFNPLHCGAVVASPSHNALPVLPRPAAEYAT